MRTGPSAVWDGVSPNGGILGPAVARHNYMLTLIARHSVASGVPLGM